MREREAYKDYMRLATLSLFYEVFFERFLADLTSEERGFGFAGRLLFESIR